MKYLYDTLKTRLTPEEEQLQIVIKSVSGKDESLMYRRLDEMFASAAGIMFIENLTQSRIAQTGEKVVIHQIVFVLSEPEFDYTLVFEANNVKHCELYREIKKLLQNAAIAVGRKTVELEYTPVTNENQLTLDLTNKEIN